MLRIYKRLGNAIASHQNDVTEKYEQVIIESRMRLFVLVLLGKCISKISILAKLGNGSTWPGHFVLKMHKNFIQEILRTAKTKIIIVAGTNGKTTTSKIVTGILKETGKTVFQNESGANLVNGIASSLLLHTDFSGNISVDYGVFEVDENALPLILTLLTPCSLILVNLFRDQLDRYGEIDTIAKKWQKSLETLPSSTNVIVNADDSQVAYLSKDLRAKVIYFGLDEKKGKKILQHASDSIYCPHCKNKLTYTKIYYSHLGKWFCRRCGLKRPSPDISHAYYPLVGTYNKYNTLAAVAFAKSEGIDIDTVMHALEKVTPAFGRQEKILYNNKQIQLFLSKNPTSFNQSLETVMELGAKNVLFVLNDRIPDGRDVSWIWDIDIEDFKNTIERITVSGDRVYDMALRVQYAFETLQTGNKLFIQPNVPQAVKDSLHVVGENETLYILPTYSAMLELRKILTGKEIP